MALWNQIMKSQRFMVNEETEEDGDIEELVGELLKAGKSSEWTPSTLTGYGPETRTILIAGEINSALACAVCSQLLVLDMLDPTASIRVIINSPGGDIVHALAIFDVMRAVQAPIITIVQGAAYSGAFMLVQGGDIRLAFPNSRFFYHEPIQCGPVTSRKESEAIFKGYEWSVETMNSIIRDRADIPKKRWKEVFDGHTALFFTAKEALDLGLVDELMEYQDKPSITLEDLRNTDSEEE